MYLSKLEILGFKSFAQKVVLKFDDGLTAIVGPNGCGKSNIVDAIRWVLGEQRPSVLRCERMENLIFGGTQTRKPLSLAEVSLYIENTKQILPTEFSEVKITRRLTRGGESLYLLNNQPVRLMDIINLFSDTGMGADAYSVIELKMVEQILNENPEERRRLFEEAAGIKKYKARRKAALRKLEATHQELNRLNDIIAEVQKKVNSLSRQVGKARRYHQYKEQLEEKRSILLGLKIRSLQTALVPLETEYEEVRATRERLGVEVHQQESRLAALQTRAVDLEHAFRKITQKLHREEEAIRQQRAEQQLLQQRKESLQERAEEYRAEIAQIKQRQKQLGRERENLLQQQAQIGQQLHEAKEQYRRSQQEVNQLEAEYHQLRDEQEKVVQFQLSQTRQADQLKEKWNLLLYRRDELQERIEKKSAALAEMEKLLQTQQNALEEAKRNRLACEQELSQYQAELNALATTLRQQESERNEWLEKRSARQVELESARNRRTFLQQVIQQYRGYSESVQHIMSRREDFPGLRDTLAHLISCPQEIRLAVEQLLGDRVSTLVVETAQTAKRILQEVREADRGRVRVLVLEWLTRPSGEPDPLPRAQPLLGQLEAPPEIQPALAHLFAGCYLAEDLKQARELAEKYPGNTFVTPAGEVLFPWGEVFAPSSSQEIPFVAQRQALQEVNARLEELEKALQEAETALQQIEQARLQAEQKRGEFEKLLAEAQQELHALEKSRDQLAFQISQLKETLQSTRQEISTWQEEHRLLDRELGQLKPQMEQFELELGATRQQEQEKRDSVRQLEERLRELRAREQHWQRQVLEITARQKELQQQLKFLDQAEKENARNIHRREQETERIASQQEEIDRRLAQLQKQLDQTIAVRDEVEKEKTGIEKEFQELKSQIQLFEAELKKKHRLLNQARERLQDLELRRKEIQVRMENLREQLGESFDPRKIQALDPALTEQQVQQEIEALEKRLNSLGEVNPLAIREHEEEKKRLEFLQGQRADVLEAEKRLMQTIRKLNKTARARFLETFQKINQNFQRVFSEFFDGDKAELYMEEGEDPLEANIEIAVTLKGKKLRSLTLLSAGEKTLTAISLLFAIYLVKPSPFCILDEVDAPLDDVNIGRFVRALKAFSRDTQFILVTHNKKTMEATEMLYGVTMEEPGVSKIVSVRVN